MVEVFCQRGFRIFSLTVIYLFIKAGYVIGVPRPNCRFPSKDHLTIPLYLDLDSVERYYSYPTPQRVIDTLRLAAEIWNKYGKSRAKIVIEIMRKGDRVPFPHAAGKIIFDPRRGIPGMTENACGVGSIVYFDPTYYTLEDFGFIYQYPDYSFLRLALHEFGHVLGIGHEHYYYEERGLKKGKGLGLVMDPGNYPPLFPSDRDIELLTRWWEKDAGNFNLYYYYYPNWKCWGNVTPKFLGWIPIFSMSMVDIATYTKPISCDDWGYCRFDTYWLAVWLSRGLKLTIGTSRPKDGYPTRWIWRTHRHQGEYTRLSHGIAPALVAGKDGEFMLAYVRYDKQKAEKGEYDPFVAISTELLNKYGRRTVLPSEIRLYLGGEFEVPTGIRGVELGYHPKTDTYILLAYTDDGRVFPYWARFGFGIHGREKKSLTWSKFNHYYDRESEVDDLGIVALGPPAIKCPKNTDYCFIYFISDREPGIDYIMERPRFYYARIRITRGDKHTRYLFPYSPKLSRGGVWMIGKPGVMSDSGGIYTIPKGYYLGGYNAYNWTRIWYYHNLDSYLYGNYYPWNWNRDYSRNRYDLSVNRSWLYSCTDSLCYYYTNEETYWIASVDYPIPNYLITNRPCIFFEVTPRV
jgi:hypothetical protein